MKKRVLVLILLAAVAHGTTSSSEAGYEQLKALAEQSYTEGSYRRAHQLYIEVRELDLSPQQIRWVEFRIADSQWRAEAATETIDKTRLEEARRSLEALAKQAEQPWQQDRVWAEAHESLGDFWWSRLSRNWGTTWIHYQKALNWWAGSKDLAAALLGDHLDDFRAALAESVRLWLILDYSPAQSPRERSENRTRRK